MHAKASAAIQIILNKPKPSAGHQPDPKTHAVMIPYPITANTRKRTIFGVFIATFSEKQIEPHIDMHKQIASPTHISRTASSVLIVPVFDQSGRSSNSDQQSIHMVKASVVAAIMPLIVFERFVLVLFIAIPFSCFLKIGQ